MKLSDQGNTGEHPVTATSNINTASDESEKVPKTLIIFH